MLREMDLVQLKRKQKHVAVYALMVDNHGVTVG